jgi:hypothetical protein
MFNKCFGLVTVLVFPPLSYGAICLLEEICLRLVSRHNFPLGVICDERNCNSIEVQQCKALDFSSGKRSGLLKTRTLSTWAPPFG